MRLLDLAQAYIVSSKDDHLEIVELVYIMNCFRRYEYPETLSNEFVDVANKVVKDYLAQPDNIQSLTHLELYRLINSIASYKTQFSEDTINNLVERYLNNAPKLEGGGA